MLPLNILPLILITSSYITIILLFLEASTYEAKINNKSLHIECIFYKKRIEIDEIDSFHRSRFYVTISSRGKKYKLLPLGGALRKVEEHL